MNTSIERTIQLTYTHRLLFTRGLFIPNNSLFSEVVAASRPGQRVRLLFVMDSGVAHAWPNLEATISTYCQEFENQLDFAALITVPGGEDAKNDETALKHVLDAIELERICRHSLVVAIGGGAVIDMVGYAAAIAHRGIGLIRIPTTVLAQNDAAVGVKNGINAYGKKNFIGTFAIPLAIINDTDFLSTLSNRDWIAGTAEAVKVALIKDAAFFDRIEQDAEGLRNRSWEAMQMLIFRCAELHIDHIALGGDPFETGSSRPLDFGHWAAHKLEHLTHYALRHGEAVAIGIAIDVHYSNRIGWLSASDATRILRVLEQLGFELQLPDTIEDVSNSVLRGIEEFREHLGGELTITLLKGIGKKCDVHQIDMEIMASILKELSPSHTSTN